jgi:hypothetical protein
MLLTEVGSSETIVTLNWRSASSKTKFLFEILLMKRMYSMMLTLLKLMRIDLEGGGGAEAICEF